MKRLGLLAVLALLAAPVAPLQSAVQDFTGKWSGSFIATMPDGTTDNDTIVLDLKQKGTELTGTAGPSEKQQWPLIKGKVEGAKLTFDVQSDGPMVRFVLTFADGHLKGDAAAEHDGRKMSAKVDAQREKK